MRWCGNEHRRLGEGAVAAGETICVFVARDANRSARLLGRRIVCPEHQRNALGTEQPDLRAGYCTSAGFRSLGRLCLAVEPRIESSSTGPDVIRMVTIKYRAAAGACACNAVILSGGGQSMSLKLINLLSLLNKR